MLVKVDGKDTETVVAALKKQVTKLCCSDSGSRAPATFAPARDPPQAELAWDDAS